MLDLSHVRRRTVIAVCAVALFAISAAAACGGDSDEEAMNGAANETAVAPTSETGLALFSEAFTDNTTIPTEYTCEGANTSPPLRWSGAPPDTGAFALLVDDPDAPRGTFDHWVVYDLPASTTKLPPGVPAGDALAGGGKQGKNGIDQTGYMGPCPPPGPEHHYRFRLFALDAPLDLAPGRSKADVENAMDTHILAETVLTGLFSR